MKQRDCQHCHTCGSPLRAVPENQEWCDTCQCYRRYRAHGWVYGAEDRATECPCLKCRNTGVKLTPTRQPDGSQRYDFCTCAAGQAMQGACEEFAGLVTAGRSRTDAARAVDAVWCRGAQ
jgi:hypothetical protein